MASSTVSHLVDETCGRSLTATHNINKLHWTQFL